jgi:hypothetical protein
LAIWNISAVKPVFSEKILEVRFRACYRNFEKYNSLVSQKAMGNTVDRPRPKRSVPPVIIGRTAAVMEIFSVEDQHLIGESV